MIRALFQLGILTEAHVRALEAFATPPVLGGGAEVGQVVSELELEMAAS